eukprot:TRINITY_DN66034_c0_g1_i1.p3 TRINITY_DN66034_c0_g1~~TRINITY_DN66034_c0_g1_i1.p3  ORF type:complete len:121 (-),score=49.76 TRINITY_DN66034_c0_g1_i1:126-488(-)
MEFSFFFFFKQKTAYEMQRGLVGSEMCIRDSINAEYMGIYNMEVHIDELQDYVDALKTCIEGMEDNTVDFNVTIGMPVFVHIEQKIQEKVAYISTKIGDLAPLLKMHFEQLKMELSLIHI